MYPELEEVKRLAKSGEYKRIPVCRELYADRFTPVEVMRTLRAAGRHCFLLESAENNQRWGRYSFLGYEPELELTCTDGVLRVREAAGDGEVRERKEKTEHPGAAIRSVLRERKSPKIKGMPPFCGGLVGYCANARARKSKECRPSAAASSAISHTNISSTRSRSFAPEATAATSATLT